MKRITRGLQALESKGLIDTVDKSKNRGLGSNYKDLLPQIQWCNLSFTRKTRTKQNSSLNGGSYWVYGRNQGDLGLGRSGGRPQHGLKVRHDTRGIGPKEVAQHPNRFWTLSCFMNFRRLWIAMDLNLVELERLWNYLSNYIKISSNRLHMWPWRRFWCRLFLESEKETKSKL